MKKKQQIGLSIALFILGFIIGLKVNVKRSYWPPEKQTLAPQKL